MSNEYIEVVKRWLADKTSVSLEELRANASAAYAAADAVDAALTDDYAAYAAEDAAAAAAAYAAADAVDAAVDAAYAAEDAAAARAARAADYWVKRYEELTNDK